MSITTTLQAGDALVVVDVQNDFLPDGALPVPGGHEIIPILNDYAARFERHLLPIFATRDWHPGDHLSFHDQGGPWPPHCIAFSRGADFPSALQLPPGTVTISKGIHFDEGYSALNRTDFEQRLRAAHIRRLFVGGLGTDYCVLHTVRDALAHGFQVFLLRDAIRPLNLKQLDGKKAEEEMYRLGALPLTYTELGRLNAGASALLTDVYELAMMQAYFEAGMQDTAVFEFFVRRLPAHRNFLIAAGLEQVLEFLEDLHFTPGEIDWLESTGRFAPDFLKTLHDFRFSGEVHAMPEGTVCFAHEPILRISAPISQAQLVETRIINLLQFQTLIAAKAARAVIAAPGKKLVEFGLRRAHGADAGVLAARACYLAGFTATSDTLAAQQLGIPMGGTMAHSFVEALSSEEEAFTRFARANPENVILLIDTFDTEEAAHRVVRLAPLLHSKGLEISGVRIDSGDLALHARAVRAILDAGGLRHVTIFASGNLDEYELDKLVRNGAPIDSFGVGTRVVTSADAPFLDCAYKIQSYAGQPRYKRSEGKATWPGVKQVYRSFDSRGYMECDTVTLATESYAGQPLLQNVMRDGKRIDGLQSLRSLRDSTNRQIGLLPSELRSLEDAPPYPVFMSERLHKLCVEAGVVPGSPLTLGSKSPETSPLARSSSLSGFSVAS
jgi:nicotinate phosphoribosyltransferase